jgi:hypothetical protein
MFHDVMFFAALSYPWEADVEQQDNTRAFIAGMFANLPCPACKQHATELFHTVPPTLENRNSFVAWCVEYHNLINRRIGKKSDWTVVEAKDAFTSRYLNIDLLKDVTAADQMRIDDHAIIQTLKQEVATYRRQLGLGKCEDADNILPPYGVKSESPTIVDIILLVLSSTICVFIVCAFFILWSRSSKY